MPTVAATVTELIDRLAGAAHLDGERLVIDDPAAFRGAASSATWPGPRPSPRTRRSSRRARWIVWEASQELGVRSASIQELYLARARGEVGGFTVPAINLRAQTFDMARTIYETAAAADVGTVILELARSEQTYTFQRPVEYVTSVLAGAIAAGWTGPVFIQGDHYQFNAAKYAADPEKMTEEIRGACRQAIEVGYRNIDIDSSTLVDLSRPTVDDQQRTNYERAAELTALIRELEPAGRDDQRRRRDRRGRQEELDRGGAAGLSRRLPARARRPAAGRARHQQGQRPDRARATAACRSPTGRSRPSSSTSRSSAGSARWPGATAWPAASSTARAPCPTSCSTTSRPWRPPRSTSRPASRTCSSSTRPSRPSSTRAIHDWCFANALDERKADQTDEQFVYTSRKKSIGPFKRQLWDLATKDEILAAQRRKIAFLFAELKVGGTAELVARYIRPVEEHRPLPEASARGRRRLTGPAERPASRPTDRATPGPLRLRLIRNGGRTAGSDGGSVVDDGWPGAYPPAQARSVGRMREPPPGRAAILASPLDRVGARSSPAAARRWRRIDRGRTFAGRRSRRRATTRTCSRSGSSPS